jgi:hypothetical protein
VMVSFIAAFVEVTTARTWRYRAGVSVRGVVVGDTCDHPMVTLLAWLRRLDDRILPARTLERYDVRSPWWLAYIGFIVSPVAFAMALSYHAAGWWRLGTAACVVALFLYEVAVVRWRREHKRAT